MSHNTILYVLANEMKTSNYLAIYGVPNSNNENK